MKKSLLLLFVLISAICLGQKSEATTIFLIRHAEKVNDGTKDPALTKKGEERAKKWASILKSESIDAIYSTNFKRTQATAQAIADAHNLSKIHSYDPTNFKVEDFITEVKGKNVVIVGHSNTTPFITNLLINEERYQQIDESNFSKLFIVHYISKDKTSAVLLSID